jgi:hypothetical protein
MKSNKPIRLILAFLFGAICFAIGREFALVVMVKELQHRERVHRTVGGIFGSTPAGVYFTGRADAYEEMRHILTAP